MNLLKTQYRILGGAIDYSLFYLIIFVYFWAFGEETNQGYFVVEGGTLPIIIFWFLYFPVSEGITGQTIGKKAMKSTVVNLKGKDLNIIDAIIRRMLDLVDMMFFGVIGILVMQKSDKNQRIGDIVAGTIVVKIHDAYCQNCHERLTLNAREVAKNEYRCPECGFQNII